MTSMQLQLPRSRQGHGSRACYCRGCREPECKAANAAYQRDYRAGRRGTTARRMGPYLLKVSRYDDQN